MLNFYFSDNFHGEGISHGIERGLLVDYEDHCLVQEGLGLGAPAIKTKTRTFFSCQSKLTKISKREFVKRFFIDSELIWEIFNVQSERYNNFNLLTILINKITDLYKKLPHFQRELLPLGIFTRDFFQTNSRIKSFPPLGSISFRYKILRDSIEVEVDFTHITRYNGSCIKKICILNELGGDYFDACLWENKIFRAPPGWEKLNINNGKKLYSNSLKLEFDVQFPAPKPNYNFNFIIGRERVSDFCWAGFDIEIDVNSIKDHRNECKMKYICSLNKK